MAPYLYKIFQDIGNIILVSLLLLMLNSIDTFSQSNNSKNVLNLIRISCESPEILEKELREEFYDIIGSQSPNTLDLVVSLKEIEILEEKGLKYSIIGKGKPLNQRHLIENQNKQLPEGYPGLEEIYQTMDSIADAYPSIVQKYDLTQYYELDPTFEGRHIFVLRISDNPWIEEDEPDIMIVSNHHAREVVTPIIALHAIRQLTSKYGSDPRITSAVNNNEIWIAPTWNPDGYNHVYNVDDYWRKNRRIFAEGIGVDQNRNYPHLWNGPHSGSTDPSSNIYKGPSAGSEAETQTMIALGLDQKFEKLIDFHSSGREVLWGYYYPTHPFDDWLHEEAVLFANNCGYTGHGNTRKPSADGENYHWHLANTGSYAFLVETHVQFTPTYSSALDEASKVWPGILWNIERKIPLSGHIKDENSQTPLIADISIAGVNYQTGEINSSNKLFGYFHLFLPPGEYDIIFSADGYYNKEEQVIILADSENILEVQMSQIPTSIYNVLSESDRGSDNKINLENYPNPFASYTNVKFRLTEAESVNLDIFNIKGQHIKSLIDDQIFPKGTYTVKWNGTNSENRKVPYGVYIIRVRAGNNYQTKKCLLTN